MNSACAGRSRRSTGTDGTRSEWFVNSEFRVHFLFFENEVTEIFSILSSPMREIRIFFSCGIDMVFGIEIDTFCPE